MPDPTPDRRPIAPLLAAAFPLLATLAFLAAATWGILVPAHWAVVLTMLFPLVFLHRLLFGSFNTRAHLYLAGLCLLLLLWTTLLTGIHGFGYRMVYGRIAALAAAYAVLLGMMVRPFSQRRFWRLAGGAAATGVVLSALVAAGSHLFGNVFLATSSAVCLVLLGLVALPFPLGARRRLAGGITALVGLLLLVLLGPFTACFDGFGEGFSPFVLADLTYQLNLSLPFILAGILVLVHDAGDLPVRRLVAEGTVLGLGLVIAMVLAVTAPHLRRGVLVAIPCAGLALALLPLWRRWRWAVLPVLLLPVLAGAALIWQFRDLPAGHARSWRIAAYRGALAMAGENRGLGSGHYGFHRAFASRTDEARHLVAGRRTDTDAHNEALDVLLDAGLPGLLILAVAAVLLMRHWRRLRDPGVRRAWLAWAAAMAVPLAFSKGVSTPYGYMALAIGAGALLAAPRRSTPASRPTTMPLWFAFPALLACVPIGLLMLQAAATTWVGEAPAEPEEQAMDRRREALRRIDRVLSYDVTDFAGMALAGEGAHLACPIDAEGMPHGDAAYAVELLEKAVAIEGERPKLLAQRLVYLSYTPAARNPRRLVTWVDRLLRHYPFDLHRYRWLQTQLEEHPRLGGELSPAVRRRLEILGRTASASCPDRDFEDFDGAIRFYLQLAVALEEDALDWEAVQEDVRRLLHAYGDIPEVALLVVRCLDRARRHGFTTGWFRDYLGYLRNVLEGYPDGRRALEELLDR